MSLCKIWIEQCQAAKGIEDEFGTQKALAYLVGEKFLNYLEAAEKDSTFQAELPAFVAEIKRIFEPWQLAECLEKARQTEPPNGAFNSFGQLFRGVNAELDPANVLDGNGQRAVFRDDVQARLKDCHSHPALITKANLHLSCVRRFFLLAARKNGAGYGERGEEGIFHGAHGKLPGLGKARL